ncbi:S-methyl-5-thioribose-1-phosphate isomerase [bacterium]|nr:S-methyl-5-thioribose-1-phosphate isomerase [bacterium]
MNIIKTIQWKDDKVIILDQTKLPLKEEYKVYEDYVEIANAIKTMVIRGAPAIGVAAAMGVAVGSLGTGVDTFGEFFKKIESICETLYKTRPTAVNLGWALDRMKRVCLENKDKPVSQLKELLKKEALSIYQEDIHSNMAIGKLGHHFFDDGDVVLTHCNAGALATAGYGTALGVIYAAQEADKRIHVIADETRPFLQGARLTAWELQKHGIDVTVITDNVAGWLMQQGKINKVIVGADRIAANGDVANKIGTYSVAALARLNKIPFYVAAPISTLDLNIADGSQIPIEERPEQEVTHIFEHQLTPDYVKVYNPAFDVTPNDLITAIITDKGVAEAPFKKTLKALVG